MKHLFHKTWSDPVWSKVIASAIVGLAAAAYVLIESFLTNHSPLSVLTSLKTLLSISAPLWVILVAIVAAVSAIFFISQKLFKPRHILIRADSITGNSYEHLHLPISKTMTVRQLINTLIANYEDEGLKNYKFGSDWELIIQSNGKRIKTISNDSLESAGIVGGSVVELSIAPWAKKKLIGS